MKHVSILITLDVHPFDNIERYIEVSLYELERFKVKATFFVTACIAQKIPQLIREISDTGHTVGCHGLNHNAGRYNGLPPERYDCLPAHLQRENLHKATDIIEQCIGKKVVVFRSPCFGLSGETIKLLDDLGYLADVSVNSQRLDLLGSDPFSLKLLCAPRLPYHPSYENAYKKGNAKLWEIPLSCLAVPFAIMTAQVLRMPLTKFLFSTLMNESRHNQKPLVYMAHPEEFSVDNDIIGTIPFRKLRLRHFLPIRGVGFEVRRSFRVSDPKKIYRYNHNIIEMMKNQKEADVLTMEEYITNYLSGH